jgi:2'-5' RNA ligase
VARVRVAVALLLPTRASDEVDGLRRALGADPDYIAPHVTLVPPLNLADDDIGSAMAVLRSAAAGCAQPLTLRIGPLDSFLPANPVVFLSVSGDLDRLGALRDACLQGPLDRPDDRPFIPHVTVTRGLGPTEDSMLRRLLGHYERDTTVERLHLLAQVTTEERPRHWAPVADVSLEPRRVIGTGGLELEVTSSELADPEARRMLATHDQRVPLCAPPWRSVVVTGRCEGVVVGVVWGRQAGRSAVLDQIVVESRWRRQGVGSHLLAVIEHDLAHHGAAVLEAPHALNANGLALLHSRGWTERPGPGGPRPWRALGPDEPGQPNSIAL